MSVDYNELIIELDKLPQTPDVIRKNVELMVRHAKYLESLPPHGDALVAGILSGCVPYIHRHLDRLQAHLDDKPDIIAWISRCLAEVLYTLRYMNSSRNAYDEVMSEQLIDLKEIEDLFAAPGTATPNESEDVRGFREDMESLWDAMTEYGVERDDLKRPKPAKHFAERSGMLDNYDKTWRFHSKYVHPSSYLLFGRENFVFGNDAHTYFLVMAQYYAALNLRDIHRMIEASNNETAGT